jgi:hypothetical protein
VKLVPFPKVRHQSFQQARTLSFQTLSVQVHGFESAAEHDLISKANTGLNSVPDLSDGMSFGPTVTLVSGVARTTRAALAIYAVVRTPASIVFSLAVAVFYRAARENTYNMLWAVLFGFATLNILGLAARGIEFWGSDGRAHGLLSRIPAGLGDAGHLPCLSAQTALVRQRQLSRRFGLDLRYHSLKCRRALPISK